MARIVYLSCLNVISIICIVRLGVGMYGTECSFGVPLDIHNVWTKLGHVHCNIHDGMVLFCVWLPLLSTF